MKIVEVDRAKGVVALYLGPKTKVAEIDIDDLNAARAPSQGKAKLIFWAYPPESESPAYRYLHAREVKRQVDPSTLKQMQTKVRERLADTPTTAINTPHTL